MYEPLDEFDEGYDYAYRLDAGPRCNRWMLEPVDLTGSLPAIPDEISESIMDSGVDSPDALAFWQGFNNYIENTEEV